MCFGCFLVIDWLSGHWSSSRSRDVSSRCEFRVPSFVWLIIGHYLSMELAHGPVGHIRIEAGHFGSFHLGPFACWVPHLHMLITELDRISWQNFFFSNKVVVFFKIVEMKYLRLRFRLNLWPLSGPFQLQLQGQHCDTESLTSLHLDVAVKKRIF